MTHYERLSGMDLSFLTMEDGRVHMHIGMVALFEAEPLRQKNGALDIERIERYVGSRLHHLPRMRQKLAWVPGIGQPVWIDDPEFNLHYHVRHTALPTPGDIRQLKRLAARIMSQELDRNKPLWEHWFVDRVDGDKMAFITKVHHCMIDGVSGVEMVRLLLSDSPEAEIEETPEWTPRPGPSDASLLVDEVVHRATAPIGMIGSQVKLPTGRPRRSDDADDSSPKKSRLAALLGAAESIGPSATPINVQIGPHRRFDWTSFSFEELHDIGEVAGGTVNDVVLAITSGALREFFLGRGENVDEMDLKAMVPVNVRTKRDGKKMGNKVSGMIAPLPVGEPDAWARLEQIVATMDELKSSSQAETGKGMAQMADLLLPRLMGPFMRRGSQATSANLAVTNVRGPREPQYLLGARQLEIYGAVPLIGNQALGIALMSYDDSLFWAFNADWDIVRDLHDLVEHVDKGFKKLKKAAAKRANG